MLPDMQKGLAYLPRCPFGDAQLLLTAPMQREGPRGQEAHPYTYIGDFFTSPGPSTCSGIWLHACLFTGCKELVQNCAPHPTPSPLPQHSVDCLLQDYEKKRRFPDGMSLSRPRLQYSPRSSSAEGHVQFWAYWIWSARAF